jgi:hypothetical protein
MIVASSDSLRPSALRVLWNHCDMFARRLACCGDSRGTEHSAHPRSSDGEQTVCFSSKKKTASLIKTGKLEAVAAHGINGQGQTEGLTVCF